MQVRIYKAGLESELLGTHEISSTQSLSEIVSFYTGEETKVSESDGIEFVNIISAGNDWLFGDAVHGPLFKITHVDAELIKHNVMRDWYLARGKTDVATDHAIKYRPGDLFYGNGMSNKFDGIEVKSVSETDHLKNLGDETCRARWIYFR